MTGWAWLLASAFCYVADVLKGESLAREGYSEHTDPPCEACDRNPWEQRRARCLERRYRKAQSSGEGT